MLSHKLLLKAGYISQLSAGIFSFTPMGWRVVNNIKKVINEEMENINCLEANLPVIQPSSIWEQSGRIDSFIPPLANFYDRRDKTMIIAPTHEEAVIELVKNNLVKTLNDIKSTINSYIYCITIDYSEDLGIVLIHIKYFSLKKEKIIIDITKNLLKNF